MADIKWKIIVAFLSVLVLTSGIVYITLTDQVRLRVDNDKSTFYVPHEDYSWIWTVSGREYNKLVDGSSIMRRDVNDITVETIIDNASDRIFIIRTTPYHRGPIIKDTYEFNSAVDNIELFPINHKVEIFNASGKFYRYEVRDLVYDGDTYKLSDETLLSFGRNMKIELNSGYRWAWVYKSGIVKAQYTINSDYEVFSVRLFDPEDEEIITYTPSTMTACLDGTCNKAIYSGIRFALDETGNWTDAGNVIKVTKDSDDIIFHYFKTKGYEVIDEFYNETGEYENGTEYNVTITTYKTIYDTTEYNLTFEAGVIHNSNYYSMAWVYQNHGVQFNFPVENNSFGKKYAINITNIPEGLQPNLESITLTYKSHSGFTIDQLKSEQGKFVIKNIMGLYFDDLVESGFIFNINKSERRIYINNLSENIVDNSLYLDPTIALTTADSENLDDASVFKYVSEGNTGLVNVVNINGDDSYTDYPIFRWNISSIPSGQQIDSAYASFNFISNNLDVGENLSINPHYVKPFPYYNITNDTAGEDQPWTEGNGTNNGWNSRDTGYDNMVRWSKRPNTSAQMNMTSGVSTIFGNSTYNPASAYYNVTVTSIISEGYNNGDKNVTILYNVTEASGSPGAVDYITIATKERAGDVKPILYITYSQAPPDVDLWLPEDDSTETSSTVNFLANITTINLDISNFSLYTNTTGTWHLNQTKYPELPNFQGVDIYNNLNMTGNVLLMHMNNNSAYGENQTHIYDFSGNGLNATTNTSIVGGFFGNAIEFSTGDTYAQTNSNIGIIGTSPRTISFRVKLNDGDMGVVVGWGTLSNDKQFGAHVGTGSEWWLWGYGSGNDWDTNVDIVPGVWQHHVITFNGTKSRWFIDGSELGSGFENVFNTGDSPVRMGIQIDSSVNRFPNGTLDEVAIWNRVLSDSEIQYLYNVTKNYHVNFTVDNMADGTYKWNVKAIDNESNSAFATNNFTFTVGDAGDELIVNLIVPPNDTISINTSYDFICNVNASPNEVVNVTFSLSNTSGLYYNETQDNSTVEYQITPPIHDATFDEDSTRSGTSTQLLADFMDGTGEVPFIKFDLSSLPSNIIIDNASIGLYAQIGSNENLDVWYVDNQTWVEGEIDDLCGNGVVCSDVWDMMTNRSMTYNGPDGSAYWDVISNSNITADVQREYDNTSNSYVSWAFNNTGSASDDYWWYSSEYSTDTSLRPYLNISYHLNMSDRNYTFSISSIPIGNYTWNCEAYDNNSDSGTADNNFTLIIEEVPAVTLLSPHLGLATENLDFNFTCEVLDNINVDNVTFKLYNSTGLYYNITNSTGLGISQNVTFSKNSLPVDNYNWTCEAFDNVGFSTSPKEFVFNIIVDPPASLLILNLTLNHTGTEYGQKMIWVENFGTNYDDFGGIVVENDIGYLASKVHGPYGAGGLPNVYGNKNIVAFNASNGSTIWSTEVGFSDGTPLIDNQGDYIYINTYAYIEGYVEHPENGIYKLNKTNGSVILENHTCIAGSVDSMTQNDVFIFSSCKNGSLIAYNKTDLTVAWSFGESDAIDAVFTPTYHDDGVMYFPIDSNNRAPFYKVNATTGAQIWVSDPDPNGNYWDLMPSIYNDMVFAGTYITASVMGAYNYTNGSKIWDRTDIGSYFVSHFAIYDDRVWFSGLTTDKIYSLNVVDGTTNCSFSANGVTQGPSIVQDSNGQGLVIFGGADGLAQIINASDCSSIWSYNTTATRLYGPSTISKGTLFTKADNYRTYAFDIGNGTGEWNYMGYNSTGQSFCSDCLDDWQYIRINCTSSGENTTCTMLNDYDYAINISLYANDTYYWHDGDYALLASDSVNLTYEYNAKSTNTLFLSNQSYAPSEVSSNFTIWNGSEWLNTSVENIVFRCTANQKECQPNNQDNDTGQCIYNITNIGVSNVASVQMKINQTFSGIDFMVDNDTTPTGAINITTIYQDIHGELLIDDSIQICAWANYSNPTSGGYFSVDIQLVP